MTDLTSSLHEHPSRRMPRVLDNEHQEALQADDMVFPKVTAGKRTVGAAY